MSDFFSAKDDLTPAEERRVLEKEIADLKESREAAMKESGKLLELYMIHKTPDLPEQSCIMKRRGDELETECKAKEAKLAIFI